MVRLPFFGRRRTLLSNGTPTASSGPRRRGKRPLPAAQLAAEMLEGRALMAANILQVSTMAASGSYNAGDVISIAVDFDEPVAVIAGNPVLNLAVTNPNNVGGWALPAVFAGQNFSRTTMYFNYTVQPGDTATNFDVILNPVGTAIQWGTISTVSDSVPADRDVTTADNTIVKLKTISIDTTDPSVPTVGYPTGSPGDINNPKDAALTLNPVVHLSLPANTLDPRHGVVFGTYNLAAGAGETLRVTVNGATYAPLDVKSSGPTGVVRQALVADGTSRIWAVDLINDIPVSGVPFSMNPWSTTDSQYYSVVATITDKAGNVSTDTSMNEIRIDMTKPYVTNVTSPLDPGTYGVGTVIYIDVECSEPMYVRTSPNQGGGVSPRLHLNLNDAAGTQSRFADFDSVQSSGNLVGNVIRFKYVVQPGDSTSDLDYALPKAPNVSALIVGGSYISDHAGNAIDQTLVAPGAAGHTKGTSGGSLGFNEAIVVDTVAAVVANVNSSWGPVSTKYTAVAGEQIPIAVLLTKQVVVTSDPTLALRVFDRNGNPIARYATYVNNVVTNPNTPTAASTLNFLYTVQPGDTTLGLDLDYLNTGALILGGPGTIKDLGGNDLKTMLAAPGSPTSLGANNDLAVQSAPVVVNVKSLTADGTYIEGQVIRLQVAFDQAVTVNGVPSLRLNGAIANAMAYFYGYTNAAGTALPNATSSQWLEFRYLVRPGDNTVGLPANELDYASNSELQIGTGAIYSLVTNTTSKGPKTTWNNAILTLYTGAPGTENWLGINNNIRIAVDLTKPAAAQLALKNDAGALPDDGISNDGTVRVTFLEGRSDPTLPEAQWMQWQYTIKGTPSGWLKLAPSAAPWTAEFVLPTGVYAVGDVKVELKDPSGNVSDPAGINTKAWTIERDLPPGLLQVSIVDTGSSASDGVTKNGTVTVGDLEAGAQLVISGLYSAQKNTDPGLLTWVPFTYTLPSQPGPLVSFSGLPEGLYKDVTVYQIDLAGNVGPTTPVNLNLFDKSFPGPTFALAANRIDYTISKLERNSCVKIYVDDMVTPVYTSNSYGAFAGVMYDGTGVPYTLQLTPGLHNVRVVQTDLAGNTQTINRTVDAGIYAYSTAFPTSPVTQMRLPVTTMTIKFNTGVQNFSLRSIKLLYNGVTMNLAGATVSQVNATTYTLTLPKNLTNPRGNYSVVVNGPSTSIKSLDGAATMNIKSYISWTRG